ncbi:MAG: protocatechuate 3,4-dioxygenase subunit alpha, partial [Actinomycetes bacterium]
PVPTRDGTLQAPHVDLSVFARGLLDRVVTRLYFGDEADANGLDPVLSTVPAHRRGTLVADRVEDGYQLDIRLHGEDETVFFDL